MSQGIRECEPPLQIKRVHQSTKMDIKKLVLSFSDRFFPRQYLPFRNFNVFPSTRPICPNLPHKSKFSPSLLQMSPLGKATLYLLLGVVSFVLSTNAAIRVRDPRLPQRLSAMSKVQNTHFIPFKVFNHFLKEQSPIRLCFTRRG